MRPSTCAAFVSCAAVLLAACGGAASAPTTSARTGSPGPPTTTTSTTSTHPRAWGAVITASTKGVTTVKSGAIVDVVLASTAYNRQGAIVPWAVPTSSDAAVLVPARAAHNECPANATCHDFVAHSVGEATLRAGGPSGIICDKSGSNCIGVTAILGAWQVKVTAS